MIIDAVVRFRRPLSVLLHLVFIAGASYAAIWLRFDGEIDAINWEAWKAGLPWLILIRATAFWRFRLFQGLWRYTSLWDLRNIVGAVSVSSGAFFALSRWVLELTAYPRAVYALDALLLICLMSGARLSRRVYEEMHIGASGRRVLVYGAGDGGDMIVRHMMKGLVQGYAPIGFIDDDTRKIGRRIHGVAVLGTRRELKAILDRVRPDEILIAIPTADPPAMREIVRSLETFNVPIKTLPNLRDIIERKVGMTEIRSLSVEDLLSRAPVGLDQPSVKRLIEGKRVLVTGAGGSIGSELCRQILKLSPSVLVLFERYENSLYTIVGELSDTGPRGGLHAVIGDVTDARRVQAVLAEHRPDIVFHAAAHKHVPLMEANPCEAVKNNVRGTRVLAEAADAAGVDRFILISTDKAVNPSSVMGATKRVAELVVRHQAQGSGTAFATVRFGNVLASNGSVVPRFLDQIRRGGPITVTHPEMRRFFMLIPEAVQLVLHAAARAEGGSTYVLEMGEQVKLVDLARNLIHLSGFRPDEDIQIEFVGLRPGEKLYEELVCPDEIVSPSGVPEVLRVTQSMVLDPTWFARVHSLEKLAEAGDIPGTLAELRALSGLHTPDAHQPPAAVPLPCPPVVAKETSAGAVACPLCTAVALHRSRARSFAERMRKGLSNKRLYRCDDCGWRGWMIPIEGGVLSNTFDFLPPPDLDTVELSQADSRRGFSPRDLL